MTWTVAIAYSAAAIISAIAVLVVSGRIGDERRPLGERIGFSLVAGGVWPVMLLGVAELSSVAIYAKIHEHDEADARVSVLG